MMRRKGPLLVRSLLVTCRPSRRAKHFLARGGDHGWGWGHAATWLDLADAGGAIGSGCGFSVDPLYERSFAYRVVYPGF